MLNSITDVSLETFLDRLKLQKLVYLIREVGYDCAFSFDWYVRGPYSPSLTRALYSADEIGELSKGDVKLNGREFQIVHRLRLLLGDKIADPYTLELLASIWYYFPDTPLTDNDREMLLDYLVEKKPHFSKEEFETGIEQISNFKEINQY